MLPFIKFMKTLEDVFKKHKEWVHIVRTFGALDDAEDIVQEMYIRYDKYTKQEQVVNTSFIWVMLRNIYFDSTKKKLNTIRLDKTIELQEEVANELEPVAFKSLIDKSQQEINEWHYFDRELFKLYLNTDKSMRDIAKETKISLSAIFYTLKRCKGKLNSVLEEDYIDFLNEDYEWIKENEEQKQKLKPQKV